MKNLFFVIILLSQTNCKSLYSSEKTPPKAEISGNDVCKLRVSFGSIGAGINHNAVNQLQKFIHDYEANTGKKLEYEVTRWGMEGETDYCFRFSDSQNKLIREIKNAISDQKWVFFEENVAARPNRYKKPIEISN